MENSKTRGNCPALPELDPAGTIPAWSRAAMGTLGLGV